MEIDLATVETNIVMFEVADGEALTRALAGAGVEVTAVGDRLIRAVTHLDVEEADVDRALAALGELLR